MSSEGTTQAPSSSSTRTMPAILHETDPAADSIWESQECAPEAQLPLQFPPNGERPAVLVDARQSSMSIVGSSRSIGDTADALPPFVARTLRDLKNLDNYLESLKERASQRLGEFKYERKLMSQRRSNVVAELQEEVEKLQYENKGLRQQVESQDLGKKKDGGLSAVEAQQLLDSVKSLEKERASLVELVSQKDTIIQDLQSRPAEGKQAGTSSLEAGGDFEDLVAQKDEQIRDLESRLLEQKRTGAALAREKSTVEEKLSAAELRIKQLKHRAAERMGALEGLLSQKEKMIRQLEEELLNEGREAGQGGGCVSGSQDVAEIDELRSQLEARDKQLEEICREMNEFRDSQSTSPAGKTASIAGDENSLLLQANEALKQEVELLKEKVAEVAAKKILQGKSPDRVADGVGAVLDKLQNAYEEVSHLYDIRDEILCELHALREEVFNPQSMKKMVKLIRDRELLSRQKVT